MVKLTILTLFCSIVAGSEAEGLKVVVERNVPVPMRDGTILRADVFRPNRAGPYPVLVQRTPYGKRGRFDRFVKAGYIVVNQDTRGRYESDGKFESYWRLGTHDAEDGYDTVEWAAKLAGSNGNVGTFGTSYPSFMQWRLAPLRPPSLVAMSACSIPARIWDVESPCSVHPAFRLEWLGMMAVDMRKHEDSAGVHTLWEHRRLWKEEEEKWLYWLPWLDLPGDFFSYETDALKAWLKVPHVDPWRLDEGCRNITVPNLDIVGWYDHCLGDMLLFRTMVKEAGSDIARDGSRIIIGPWSHGPSRRYGDIDFGPGAAPNISDLRIAWFDYWLKGKPHKFDDYRRVRIFVMGDNQWRDEMHWPLQRSKKKTLYLTSRGQANTPNGDGRLVAQKTESVCTDTYVYDPNDPVPTPYGARRPIPADQRPLARRQDVLVYQTEPLTERIEITGNPEVILYAASSAPDTDWFVKLIDVAPGGFARDVSSGMVRARYRNGFDKTQLIKPGGVIEYKIYMTPTSNAFLSGHRIRLDITSSDFPNYDRNHNTAANQNANATLVTANQTIYHGGERATRIILPWVENSTEEEKPVEEEKPGSQKETYLLHQATAEGDTEQIKLLLGRGIDIDAKDDDELSPLHLAVRRGHRDVAELLIVNGADINAADKNHVTALHTAALKGDRDMTALLIAKGADPNARDRWLWSPLHYTAQRGHKDVTELLIATGADINARSDRSRTPLHQAVSADRKEIIELLIVKGANINAQDDRGDTPLHLAVSANKKEIVKLLMANGADINARDANRRSPLILAIVRRRRDMAELLIQKGADINAESNAGLNPLHTTAVEGYLDIAELLLARGAKVDAQDDNYEFTALHYAARFGTTKVAGVLIAHGADIKAKDKWDYQPIHWAAYHDRPEIIELLIAKGADVNAKTSLGQTPLELATPRKNTTAIEVLRKHGAKE